MAVNKKIREILKPETVLNYNPKNKGWIGNSIESDWFGLPNNSRKEADFANLNLELKVTPIIKTKNGWSAKERLVLNIFDFNDEYKREFSKASFLEKAKLIELIYYEYKKDIPAPDFFIKAATLFDLHNLPEEDKLIIEQDWNLIINKIKEGKAEELSDSLTKYLGATTKGSKSEKNMTNQPFSDVKAHRRSFTLKGSYMTELVRKIMSGQYQEPPKYAFEDEISFVAEAGLNYDIPEPVIKNINLLKTKSFEEIITERFTPYKNMSKKQLAKKFNVKIPDKNDKASTPLLARKILNLQTDIQNTEEFLKAGISVKTITVNSNQLLKPFNKRKTAEAFKLQNYFNFEEIINIDWYESDLYEYLYSTRFLLVIFEKNNKDEIFKGVKFWSMPVSDLDGLVYSTWKKTVDIISEGVTLEYKPSNNKKGYIVRNNFPTIKDDTILHVRPDAQLSSYKNDIHSLKLPKKSNWIDRPNDKIEILSDYYMTKQAFWLNPNYMYRQVDEFFSKD